MPEGSLRVLHVNDVAGVASAAVAQARADGLDWRLWPLPTVRGARRAVKVARRLGDVVRFRPAGRAADVLHVHYGLFGYYAWSVHRPYLLHLHGTDVRVNLAQPILGRLVRAGIKHAGVVAYSTPDLDGAVRALRDDAVWLPAPVSSDALTLAAAPADRAQFAGLVQASSLSAPVAGAQVRPWVVFASRWDAVKGLEAQLDLAARLRAERPELVLIGIDWGAGTGRARSAGVRLLPRLSPAEFRALLSTADVVIGQLSSGCLGVSDLEAMVMRRPLVARFTAQAAYGARPPIWNTTEYDAARAVGSIVDDPAAARSRVEEAATWALAHHSPRVFVDRATELYRTLREGAAAGR